MRNFFVFVSVISIIFTNLIVFAQEETTVLQENNIPVESSQTANENFSDTGEKSNIDELNNEMGLGEQRQIIIDDVQSSPNDNKDLTKKVVPNTRSELTKMVKMFLKVMLAVAISSVIIFAVLLFVRRFYSPAVTFEDLNSDEQKRITLDTPQNKNEALKTFLDKTKEM